MGVEELQRYCESLNENVTAELPFGPDTMTMKIGGKIFCFISLDENPTGISIKLSPEKVIEVKESVEAAYSPAYLNRKHWVGLRMEGNLPADQLKDWIGESYSIIFDSLTKKQREALVG